jgi:hypothetical protein
VRFSSFSATSLFLDPKLPNAPRAKTLSASTPILASFAWWRHWVDGFVDLPFLPAWNGEHVIFRALTIVVCVDFVVRWDIGCCKLWTIWRQAASFMSTLVRLLILNKAKSSSWHGKKSGIVTLTVQPDLIVRVLLMKYPRDYWRQTSSDIPSLEQHPIDIQWLGDSSGCTPQFIVDTK